MTELCCVCVCCNIKTVTIFNVVFTIKLFSRYAAGYIYFTNYVVPEPEGSYSHKSS
jgi:hypothetical protein